LGDSRFHLGFVKVSGKDRSVSVDVLDMCLLLSMSVYVKTDDFSGQVIDVDDDYLPNGKLEVNLHGLLLE
jgi:hypothetical protein